MITVETKKLPKKTYELLVKVKWEKINEEYKKAFKELLSQYELPGFRKGKVPEKIAEKEIKKESIYDRLIRRYIPELYQEALKKTELKPIISPKVELIKAKDNEDWELKFVVAEKPDIDLGEYKTKVKEAKEKAKEILELWLEELACQKQPIPIKTSRPIIDEVKIVLPQNC